MILLYLTKNRHSDSRKQGQLTFSGYGEEERWHCIWWWWWWWCSENQCVTNLSDHNTVCWGKTPQDLVCIAPSAYQTGKKEGRGETTDGQNGTQISPSWVHTSQLIQPFMWRNRVYKVHQFSYNYLWLGKMNKAEFFFSQPIQSPPSNPRILFLPCPTRPCNLRFFNFVKMSSCAYWYTHVQSLDKSFDFVRSSVVDPKLLFSDPALGLISDSDPDLTCLTKVIRLYLICPQESIAQRFSSHFRRWS